MNLIQKLLLCTPLVGVTLGEQRLSQREQVLSAEIQNARVLSDQATITFDFVITNNSPKPVSFAERWNGFGADQWTIQLVNSDGSKFTFSNPQDIWYKNYLTVVTIEPTKQHRSQFKLTLGHPNTIAECEDTFAVSRQGFTEPKAYFSFPLQIVGIFAASELHEDHDVATNWTGEIRTKEIEIKNATEQDGSSDGDKPPN
jgi:hypothetical protein